MKKILKLTWIVAACLTVCLSMSACFKTDDTEVKDISKETEERVKLDEAKKPVEKTAEPAGETKELTLGEINGNVYSNDYFGFEFTFADNWEKIYSREDLMRIVKTLAKVDLSDEIDLATVDGLELFAATKHDYKPSELTADNRPSQINIYAHKISSLDNITTVEEYIEWSLEDYKSVTNGIQSTKFGSQEIKYIETTPEVTKKQGGRDKFFVCEANGYFLCISTSDRDYETSDDIENFINSINFK